MTASLGGMYLMAMSEVRLLSSYATEQQLYSGCFAIISQAVARVYMDTQPSINARQLFDCSDQLPSLLL